MQNVRFRIDLSSQCSIGPRKIDLLEAVGRAGSIRQAAISLGMSYRHAWLLIDDLNRSFAKPVTRSIVGGQGGGGMELTELGSELIRRYRGASHQIELFVRAELAEIAPKARLDAVSGGSDVARQRLAKGKPPAGARRSRAS